VADRPVELAEAVRQGGNGGLNWLFLRCGMGAHVRLPRAVETLWIPHPEYTLWRKPTEWSDSTKVVRVSMCLENHALRVKASTRVT